MKIVAAHYYNEPRSRLIANRMKDPSDEKAIEEAANDMAPHVPYGAIVVPAPSSTGYNPATRILAHYIASMVDGLSVEAVKRVSMVESSLLRRRVGRSGVGFDAHVASMRRVKKLQKETAPIVFVDNVVTSGSTLEAMRAVLELGDDDVLAVVYADARRYVRQNDATPTRVCIAGSRGYKHLERIDAVLDSLAPDTVIVSGAARGVDAYAARSAQERGFRVEEFKADWERLGRAAGPVRNRAMIETCQALYAFWDGASRGTLHAMRTATLLGLPIEVVLDD